MKKVVIFNTKEWSEDNSCENDRLIIDHYIKQENGLFLKVYLEKNFTAPVCKVCGGHHPADSCNLDKEFVSEDELVDIIGQARVDQDMFVIINFEDGKVINL